MVLSKTPFVLPILLFTLRDLYFYTFHFFVSGSAALQTHKELISGTIMGNHKSSILQVPSSQKKHGTKQQSFIVWLYCFFYFTQSASVSTEGTETILLFFYPSMEISQTDCVAHSVCLLFCTVKPSVLFCPKDGPLGKVRLYNGFITERYISSDKHFKLQKIWCFIWQQKRLLERCQNSKEVKFPDFEPLAD